MILRNNDRSYVLGHFRRDEPTETVCKRIVIRKNEVVILFRPNKCGLGSI